MLNKLELFCEDLYFFCHRDNWHKFPVLRRLICWIGRHDYEKSLVEARKAYITVALQCFYCNHIKKIYIHPEEIMDMRNK